MDAVAPPADQAVEILQKFTLDSETKTIEIPDATKKPSNPSSKGNGIQSDRSVTPILPDCMDPTVCYVPNGYPSGYYYSGHDGSANKWEDHTKYMNPDGVEMAPGVYGDNGSLMFHTGFGYAPYGPYSHAAAAVPTVGHDGQLYGAQPYQYPTYFPSTLTPTSGPYPTTAAPTKGDNPTSAAADQTTLSVDSTNSKKTNGIAYTGGAKGTNETAPVRAAYQSPSFNGSYGRGALPGVLPVSGYQDLRYGFDGIHVPFPWVESPYYSGGPVNNSSINSSVSNGNGFPASRNQNFRPNLMGLHNPRPISGMSTANGYLGRIYPNKLYGQYGNNFRYAANSYDSRSNGRGWLAADNKYKPRGRGNGFYHYANESIDGLNELNRGPRCKSSKNQKGFTPGDVAVKDQNIPLTGTNDSDEKISSVTPDPEQYNRPDFLETCADAKFFVIKSYSEDDVHNSIKHNVWSSTPNGNKKLDAAYVEAQQISGGCPIFLFFSVNTSGQFLGVAEMIGPVDFNKNVEYWQQDKWIGCFPVKWHIVKDVPNSLLKHITLENNENKPVTNSRDTQEVKLEQGLQVIKLFKDHVTKQCILDDFDFYEDRQKRVQERKAKQQQFQKQAQVCKPIEENNEITDINSTKFQKTSSESVSSDLNKEAASVVQDTVDIPKNLGGATEEVANGC